MLIFSLHKSKVDKKHTQRVDVNRECLVSGFLIFTSIVIIRLSMGARCLFFRYALPRVRGNGTVIEISGSNREQTTGVQASVHTQPTTTSEY